MSSVEKEKWGLRAFTKGSKISRERNALDWPVKKFRETASDQFKGLSGDPHLGQRTEGQPEGSSPSQLSEPKGPWPSGGEVESTKDQRAPWTGGGSAWDVSFHLLTPGGGWGG